MFVKCSAAASPPSLLNTAQLSSSSQSRTESSGQLKSRYVTSNADARASVPVAQASYQMPACSPRVPQGLFQQPPMLNPVFIDSRPPVVSPPPAVVAVPMIAPAVFPQQYIN